jgi:formamidopyrimidine-DNA glycosylase
MIELPEALSLAAQLNKTITGKRISKITAGHTPHKLAWYYGNPPQYSALVVGKKIDKTLAFGSHVEIHASGANILFGEGVNLRFHSSKDDCPQKHQLLIEFEGPSAISASVQMYGGLGCFQEGNLDNPYYKAAKEKPSPLSEEFADSYFSRMIDAPEVQKLSAKAFLATEQRIPGLGNGVLQDILFFARIHPKRKIQLLTDREKKAMFKAVKSVLQEMVRLGGRDTEVDIFGKSGGYPTKLSKKTSGQPCPNCRSKIIKENYLGGSIYFCPKCQS